MYISDTVIGILAIIVFVVVPLVYMLLRDKADTYDSYNYWLGKIHEAGGTYLTDLKQYAKEHPNMDAQRALFNYLTDDLKKEIQKKAEKNELMKRKY